MKLYAIIGAGGFGRQIMPVAREMIGMCHGENNDIEIIFVVETIEKPTVVNKHKVISEEDFFSYKADEKYFNIAIADYQARERIANKFLAKNINPFMIQSLYTVIHDNNSIGEGAVLCPFTIIESNVKIGRFFHANKYSYVSHDSIIGDFVTFAPNVHCNGRVVVEDYAYIGAGAIIKQGTEEKPVTIGKGCIVGMGAVVTKSVPPFTTVVGNPASELKKK